MISEFGLFPFFTVQSSSSVFKTIGLCALGCVVMQSVKLFRCLKTIGTTPCLPTVCAKLSMHGGLQDISGTTQNMREALARAHTDERDLDEGFYI